MNLDKDIILTLSKTTKRKPIGLSDIIAAVDYRQHLIISYEELLDGLQRLVLSGKAIETNEYKYYLAPKSLKKQSNKFRGFPKSIYDDSLAAYKQLAETVIAKILKGNRLTSRSS